MAPSKLSKKRHKGWHTNAWVKKAILLYFRLSPVKKMDEGHFFDKIPLKTFSAEANRIVPYSSVRRGAVCRS